MGSGCLHWNNKGRVVVLGLAPLIPIYRSESTKPNLVVLGRPLRPSFSHHLPHGQYSVRRFNFGIVRGRPTRTTSATAPHRVSRAVMNKAIFRWSKNMKWAIYWVELKTIRSQSFIQIPVKYQVFDTGVTHIQLIQQYSSTRPDSLLTF